MNPERLEQHLRQTALYHRLKTQAQYRSRIRAAVRALWSGVWDIFEFYDNMLDIIEAGFDKAWDDGMKAAGLSFADITPEEGMKLNEYKINERQFIFSFGEAIEEGSRENEGKLGPLFSRVDLWVNRWNVVKQEAMTSASSDPYLQWVLNAAESCSSCLKLSGQVRRSSVWNRLGLRPGVNRLECQRSAGGISVCKCQFQPSDGPATRGRVPSV